MPDNNLNEWHDIITEYNIARRRRATVPREQSSLYISEQQILIEQVVASRIRARLQELQININSYSTATDVPQEPIEKPSFFKKIEMSPMILEILLAS